MAYILPDTELLTIKQVAETGVNQATFEIEPLSPGYGVTVGNTLRRILLSSMEGAAITSVRIDGATHEFTTVPGVHEDMVNLILNMKQVKLRLHGNEPTSLVLTKKGPGAVTVADFKANSAVEFINPEQVIANLDKGAQLNLEIEVRKGRGYSPVEARRDEKLPLGTIAIDSIFSPVIRVTYDIENTRVGNVTNYDKLIMTVITDGSISPQDALQTAAKIAVEHFSAVAGITTNLAETETVVATAMEVTVDEDAVVAAPKKRASRKTATKEEE
ncbi:MAG TPA: DNA-directed RNA polymerase subunit alpha [Patescibacteria group bacterium]